MARLAMCGWESGDVNEIGAPAISSGTQTIQGSARSGNYCIRCANPSYAGAGNSRTVSLPSVPSEIYFRLAARRTAQTGPHAAYLIWLQILGGGTHQLQFWNDFSNNLISLKRGGTVIASGGALGSQWVCIEVYVLIHPTNGIVYVWQNGVLIISFTGNTRNGTASEITGINFGSIAGAECYCTMEFDDFAINDTTGSVNNGRIGQGGIVALWPNADTADKDFSRSVGSDNYSLVNSFPPDGDTTYVEAGTIGDLDLYQHQQIGGAGTVDAVWLTLTGRVVNGAAAPIQPTIKSVATTMVGSPPIYLVNTYATQGRLFETDPNGGIPWTTTAVNSALIGMTVV